MTTDFLKARAAYSEQGLSKLRAAVQERVSSISLDGLTIFTAGSYARLEAGEHSDIDLFFAYHPTGEQVAARHTNELKLFGRLIDLAEELKFPPFSNDAEFLHTQNIDDILLHLGGPSDDAQNHFTLRMLLLLESKCIFGEEHYQAALREVIHSYYRDFPNNESSFEPWFLINDVMRYWKTLLLNYENRRNQGDDEATRNGRRVKNFKLRFSRMTTCFATIAALGSHPGVAQEGDVFALASRTPQERFEIVKDNVPATGPLIEELLQEYSWFLTQTSLTKEDLHAKFRDDGGRRTMFERAEHYGTLMYQLLGQVDDARANAPKLLRYLVI